MTLRTSALGLSLTLAAILFAAAATAAPGVAERDTVPGRGSGTFWSVAGHLVRADLDELVSRRTLFILGSGAGLSAASRTFENSDREATGLERPPWDGVSDLGNTWGDGVTLGAAALALVAAGRVTGNSNVYGTGVDMSRALLYSGVMVYGLKYAVNRTRPNGEPYSFPSGHSAAAFCVAPVIGAHFGRWAALPVYALATATTMGRMEDRKHYLSDVVFGAAIGTAAGLAVTHSSARAWVPSLAVGPGQMSLGLTF
jgi:membrane-associated phospholipid phosphatase